MKNTVKFKVTEIVDIRKSGSEIEIGNAFIGEWDKNKRVIWYRDKAGCDWCFYPGDTCEILNDE